MEVIKKQLNELTKNPMNVRKHSEKQLKEYVRSLEMFGQVRPIVIDEAGVIIAGNGMYDALTMMGAETCECYVASGLTESQKKKLMLADNKVYDLGVTDMSMFDEVIRDLGGDVDIPGYDEELLKLILSDVNEATDSIKSYGVYEPENIQRYVGEQRPVQSYGKTEAELSQENKDINKLYEYEPTRSEAQRTDAVAEDAEEKAEVRKFVICSKCGEKIWL